MKKTGWTGDEDEEGLIEENPFVFIVAGAVILAVAAILYYVGIDYDPGWFEGENLVSSMGIIFLIIFIPAIAISTLTGRSDLVKWEAVFLLISVVMIYVGNNFDWDSFLASFGATIGTWKDLNWGVKDLITIVLIFSIIVAAYSAATGGGFGLGSAVVIIACLALLALLHSGWMPGDSLIGGILGLPGSQGGGGVVPENIEDAAWGLAIGSGAGAATVIGLALMGTGIGAPVGMAIIAAGAALGFMGGYAGIDFSAIPNLFGIVPANKVTIYIAELVKNKLIT